MQPCYQTHAAVPKTGTVTWPAGFYPVHGAILTSVWYTDAAWNITDKSTMYSLGFVQYLQSVSIHGLRMALCWLTRTLGLSHKESDVTWVRICTGSLHNSASAIFLEEVPPLTHWHHLSLYTWWHLLAFFMCQSINIRTVQERKIPSAWVLRDGKLCHVRELGYPPASPVEAKHRGQQVMRLSPLSKMPLEKIGVAED